MLKLNGMTAQEVTIIKTHLPELMVMARARHASDLQEKQIDIKLCGVAKIWEECCTITDMGDHTQAMLWYNIGPSTHGVALEINR